MSTWRGGNVELPQKAADLLPFLRTGLHEQGVVERVRDDVRDAPAGLAAPPIAAKPI